MDRSAYNVCMKPYISGQHEDRKMDFCIGAKICSGKTKDKNEARAICSQPKPPKPPSTRRGKCNCQELVGGAVASLQQYLSIEPQAAFKLAVNQVCGKAKGGTGKVRVAEVIDPERQAALDAISTFAREMQG